MTTSEIKNMASWFLYIFIAENAPLNKTIMTKRDNQVTALKRLGSQTGYNYEALKNLIYQGTIEQTGHTPAYILQALYAQSISGIGSVDSNFTPDGENASTGDETKYKLTTDQWIAIIQTVSNTLVKVINTLGFKQYQIQPVISDWNYPLRGSSFNLLPVLVGGGVLALLIFMNTTNDESE